MIIENGTVQAKIKTGGGLNDQGNPVKPSESWGVPIPCNIKTNQSSNNGVINGNTFSVSSYEILIDSQPFKADRVQLVRNGEALGEFKVQQIEPLIEVGNIKILV